LQTRQGSSSGWGKSHGWQEPLAASLAARLRGTFAATGTQRSQADWSGQGFLPSQAFSSAAQSDSRWTLGNGGAGGAPEPNQKSAG